MDARTWIDIMRTTGRLKDMTRHSWTAGGRHESVAEHTYHLLMMAYFCRDEFPRADMEKVMEMCLFHDMGEAFTGDIPAFEKTADDEAEESRRVSAWVESLPEPYRRRVRALFAEMNAMETEEARIYKALDKLEAVIQHNEADLSTWLPLEYELNLVYGEEQTRFSEFFREARRLAREDSLEKIAREAAERSDGARPTGSFGGETAE